VTTEIDTVKEEIVDKSKLRQKAWVVREVSIRRMWYYLEMVNVSGDGDELGLHQKTERLHIAPAEIDVLKKTTPAGWYPCSAHQAAGF
jgi:hypothetical protein